MLLNDSWTMIDGDRRYSCSVPCSAMQVLLREGVIPDPYYRENEWISTPVSERDFTFEKNFTPEDGLLEADRVLLGPGSIPSETAWSPGKTGSGWSCSPPSGGPVKCRSSAR